MRRNARIVATGMFAPDRVIPNQYFNDLLGEDVDTWLVENLTIRERRWCSEHESTADLVVRAAENTLANAGENPQELDLIVVSTDTPEYISPSTASVAQHRLNATRAAAFDINSACAGFVTALDMGAKYIQIDPHYNKVLVVGAYAMSKFLNMQDKKTVTLFADGAGAALLHITKENRGWLGARLVTEGKYHDWMGIYGGGTHKPIGEQVLTQGDHKVKFVRKFPKDINPVTWTRMIREVVEDAGCRVEDIAMIFLTQININSIRETLENLNLPMSKTHTIMDRFGYTGSACIPMAMAEAVELDKLHEGDLVVFMGSGGGLSFAAAAFRW